MDNQDSKNVAQGEHYICLGGCRGVSKTPGVCKTPGCLHEGHQLVKCNCVDGKHNNFEPM